MAYTSGEATDYKNLLVILTTFAAANGWTVLTQTETEVYMRGEGTEGLDKIYCGIKADEDSANSKYNWKLYGSISYRSGADISAHPLSSDNVNGTYSPFWNNTIPYWIRGDASCIVLAAKIGTIYTHVYLGFLDPPATTQQYPYPLFIGGTTGTSTLNYTSTSHAAYWGGGASYVGSLYLPVGPWGRVSNTYSLVNDYVTIPWLRVYSLYHGIRGSILPYENGDYLLDPIFIRYNGDDDIYGQLKGVFAVSGYNNSSENIITVDGVNYIVFQDMHRVGIGNYCAMRMS